MGRGVDYASGAEEVLYFALPDIDDLIEQRIADEPDEEEWLRSLPPEAFYDELRWVWEDFVSGIQYGLSKHYESFDDADEWVGRELRTISQNSMTEIVVSEYCGLASVSIVARYDEGCYDGQDGLREWWTRRMAPHIAQVIRESVYLDELNQIGRFSNGECVYKRRAA